MSAWPAKLPGGAIGRVWLVPRTLMYRERCGSGGAALEVAAEVCSRLGLRLVWSQSSKGIPIRSLQLLMSAAPGCCSRAWSPSGA